MAFFLGRWKASYMAMFTVYLDASGSPDNSAALTVAGFVATAEQWIEFERNWNDALRAYGVSEMHMKKFAPGVGEFAPWKHDKIKRRIFVERLVNIVKTRARHSFAMSVILEAYRMVDKKYCLDDAYKPLSLAGVACIDRVRLWAEKWAISEQNIAYVFEDGDKDRGHLIACTEKHHGFTPNFMKKQQSAAFQAADMLAYEQRLMNIKIQKGGVRYINSPDIRKSLIALDDVPHDGGWGVYDFAALEEQCIADRTPLRIAS